MEQHPIPQNISGFQFKLIGDITLKQFAYVAGGLITAYLMTKISLVPSLLRYPIAAIFALLGFGLAFVPIEERPLDRWLSAFIKSIYAPTQYVWKKSNQPPEILSAPLSPTTSPLPMPKAYAPPVTPKPTFPSVPPQRPAPIPFKPVQPPKPITPAVKQAPPPLRPIPPPPPPAPKAPPKADTWTLGAPPSFRATTPPIKTAPPPNVTGKRIVFENNVTGQTSAPKTDPKQVEKLKSEFQQKTQALAEQITSLQRELATGSIAKDRLLELQQVLSTLLSEKDRLSNEDVKMRQQLDAKAKPVTEKPTTYVDIPETTQTTVKIVPPRAAMRIGMPSLTTVPNVITGIIKDSAGILLPNIIVTVKDKDGVPVRALKTNKLGQFAASTPLSYGTYVIDVEDPKKSYQFNRIEVTLSGMVLPPLEISAVSQKDLMRQKLTQEIFGPNTL